MNYQIIADESVDFRIVVQLRQRKITVYSVAEQSPSIQDEIVLKLAYANNALLITEDKDFGELVFRLRLKHKGILLIKIGEPQKKIPMVVEAIAEHYEVMLGKFSVIDSKKLRIKA